MAMRQCLLSMGFVLEGICNSIRKSLAVMYMYVCMYDHMYREEAIVSRGEKGCFCKEGAGRGKLGEIGSGWWRGN